MVPQNSHILQNVLFCSTTWVSKWWQHLHFFGWTNHNPFWCHTKLFIPLTSIHTHKCSRHETQALNVAVYSVPKVHFSSKSFVKRFTKIVKNVVFHTRKLSVPNILPIISSVSHCKYTHIVYIVYTSFLYQMPKLFLLSILGLAQSSCFFYSFEL